MLFSKNYCGNHVHCSAITTALLQASATKTRTAAVNRSYFTLKSIQMTSTILVVSNRKYRPLGRSTRSRHAMFSKL